MDCKLQILASVKIQLNFLLDTQLQKDIYSIKNPFLSSIKTFFEFVCGEGN